MRGVDSRFMCRVLSFVRTWGPSDEKSGGDIDFWRATTAELLAQTHKHTHTHTDTATDVVADVLVVLSDCVVDLTAAV